MYFVKLRFAPYESGSIFYFHLLGAATNFVENALSHGLPDKDGIPLVAEIWADDSNSNTRKPDDEEE